jgi:hypothetical protein
MGLQWSVVWMVRDEGQVEAGDDGCYFSNAWLFLSPTDFYVFYDVVLASPELVSLKGAHLLEEKKT